MENQDNDEEIKLNYKELADFCNRIIEEADKNINVEGVRVFR